MYENVCASAQTAEQAAETALDAVQRGQSAALGNMRREELSAMDDDSDLEDPAWQQILFENVAGDHGAVTS